MDTDRAGTVNTAVTMADEDVDDEDDEDVSKTRIQ